MKALIEASIIFRNSCQISPVAFKVDVLVGTRGSGEDTSLKISLVSITPYITAAVLKLQAINKTFPLNNNNVSS